MDGFFTAGMATSSVGSESLPLALAVCESLANKSQVDTAAVKPTAQLRFT